MSVDLDIIPDSPKLPPWGQVRRIIGVALSHNNYQTISPDISLYEFSSKRELQDDEELKCPGYYYFGFAQDTTLTLSLESNTGGQEEMDYVDDFARCRPLEFKESIRQIWKSSGFLITVTSGGGRAKGELQQMICIASCIAKLTKGYIVVSENGVFQQPVGIYTPDEFVSSNVRPVQ